MKYQRDRVLFEERLIIESLTIRIASVDYDTRNAEYISTNWRGEEQVNVYHR
jgi:hypothetical protein